MIFWTDQLTSSVVVLMYASAIILRADLSEKSKHQIGSWLIVAIILILLCGAGTATAAMCFVNQQIRSDNSYKNSNRHISTFQRAVKKIAGHKQAMLIHEKHKVSFAAKEKKLHINKNKAKDRLLKRLTFRRKASDASSSDVPRHKQNDVTSKTVEVIRKMLFTAFKTSARFKKAAKTISLAERDEDVIFDIYVFGTMVRKVYYSMAKMNVDDNIVRSSWVAAAGGNENITVLDIENVIVWLQLQRMSPSS